MSSGSGLLVRNPLPTGPPSGLQNSGYENLGLFGPREIVCLNSAFDQAGGIGTDQRPIRTVSLPSVRCTRIRQASPRKRSPSYGCSSRNRKAILVDSSDESAGQSVEGQVDDRRITSASGRCRPLTSEIPSGTRSSAPSPWQSAKASAPSRAAIVAITIGRNRKMQALRIASKGERLGTRSGGSRDCNWGSEGLAHVRRLAVVSYSLALLPLP
ncbi:hypothetical protein FBZ93_11173 [Bradyrhizobium macuxiense]|uniref:Uncharacterized protein n=1 Tax=Bradyrhizobium macuxiense TaxID=1755647 RepID=A0A560LF20_9BRAD|nr:hypothetical protein FBZ93_11173 [Bradyrhizobium macuxiense]